MIDPEHKIEQIDQILTEGHKKLSFDEFKLFYESTEKVTDRRLSQNQWNYSVCTATLVAIAIIINWGLTKNNFIIVAIFVVIILSIIAIIYCSFWISQMEGFKNLNNAKFQVLNQMTQYVVFSENDDDSRISYNPFEREWIVLQKQKATERIQLQNSRLNILVLKSSTLEYLLPKAFRVIFIMIIIVTLVFTVMNFKEIRKTFFLKVQVTNHQELVDNQ